MRDRAWWNEFRQIPLRTMELCIPLYNTQGYDQDQTLQEKDKASEPIIIDLNNESVENTQTCMIISLVE